jgi:C4-dicarboxylate-specific signal transduction histidine kinase
MNEDEMRLLREQALSFFGTITASLSHEINNSMAIISELSGLLEDLLVGADRDQPLDNDKLRELSQRISNQVKKGQSIIKRLNRFAHSMDEPDAAFDAVEVLEQLMGLAQRFAFLKGVRLDHTAEQESLALRGNPFSLQQAVFICIQLALDASTKSETVNVTLRGEDSAVRIITTCASLSDEQRLEPDMSFLSLLMEELGGNVEIIRNADDTKSFVLTFPGFAGGG